MNWRRLAELIAQERKQTNEVCRRWGCESEMWRRAATTGDILLSLETIASDMADDEDRVSSRIEEVMQR